MRLGWLLLNCGFVQMDTGIRKMRQKRHLFGTLPKKATTFGSVFHLRFNLAARGKSLQHRELASQKTALLKHRFQRNSAALNVNDGHFKYP
jgi:hypothetical protein